MNRRNGVRWRITPLDGIFEGSSNTVKREKYNLDGVADTLHHILPLFETGLW